MSNQTDVVLAKAAMALRGTHPPAWDAFMQALAARVDEITEALVSAPPTEMSQYQGRAREVRAIFLVLSDAPQLVQKLQEKERQDAYRKSHPISVL
jgi:hypothetical protein